MRARPILAKLTILAILAGSSASAEQVRVYRLKHDLVRGCVGSDLDFCTGYIAGVVDVFSALHAGTGNTKFELCLPHTVTPLMLTKAVVEWIDAHGTRDQDAAGSVVSAIVELYPCSSR